MKIDNGEKKLKESTVEAIDTLSDVVKTTSRKFLDACIQRSVEVFSGVFDKYLEKAKEKIKKRG